MSSYSATAPIFAFRISFSRADEANSTSDKAGVLTAPGSIDIVLKTRVPDAVADDFRRKARLLGISVSELLRLLVLTRLYGVSTVVDSTSKQIVLAAGDVPKKGQEA